MFPVAKAGVFWVCKQWHICIIKLIRDARVGIPWIGVGAVGTAAFMLAWVVSIMADMVNNRWVILPITVTYSIALSWYSHEFYHFWSTSFFSH